jgi:hypothetical protein
MNQNRPLPKLATLARAILRTQDRYSDKIVVRFKNLPTSNASRFLIESILCEGKVRHLSGGFKTISDTRPANQGGNQLHIHGPHGQKWAYRETGARSEPNNYTLPTTNRIRDIVSQHFGIHRNLVEKVVVRSANRRQILVEVTFS